MDTTKDIVDEEVNVDVATSDEQPNTNTTNTINNTSNTLSGLQQMEDDNEGLPLPAGMAEVISNRAEPPKQIGKVEQIDDDNISPEPPAMLEVNAADPEIASKTTAAISNNLSSVNELTPPGPFDSAEFEDKIAKKKAKDDKLNQKPAAVSVTVSTDMDRDVFMPSSGRDSIYEPPREVIEGGEVLDNTNTGRGDMNRRGWDDIGSGSNDSIGISAVPNEDIDSGGGGADSNNDVISREVEEVTQEDIHIPVAWKVEDNNDEDDDRSIEEVFIATPTLPWWKQRRTRIFFGVVVLLLGAMAIALGVSLSQSNTENTVFLNITDTPTVSVAPSSSMAPSTSPPTITYECFDADDGGEDGILYNAVRAYVRQDCANNEKCFIAQTYGWPMNSWCVGSVKDMSYLFQYMDTFNEDINGWNTSSVTDMTSMFWEASLFNGDVSNFDTSSVRGMASMFNSASSFNQDVSSFDLSSVTDMRWMFYSASSFNQNLYSWRDSFPYTNADDIFLDSGCTYQDTPNESQNGPFCASDCESSPSMSPSSSIAPTTSPKPTQSPTVSSLPTETCYWIDIVVVHDQYPEETSWDIQTINGSGNNVVLKTFNGTSNGKYKAQKESVCLEGEQTYQFTIYDSEEDGICCEYGKGYYNVTSNGSLIAQGGGFTLGETTSFPIPFIPGSAISSALLRRVWG